MGSFAPGRVILKQADLNPALYAPVKMPAAQQSFAALERAIYGQFTPPTTFQVQSSEILTTDWLEGRAIVERRVYKVSHGQTPQSVEFIFVLPPQNPNAPLIISQNFSSNRNVIATDKQSPLNGEAMSFGPLESIFTYFFGRHIVEPPLADILDRGYGFVAFHPPDYIADHSERGANQLNMIFGDTPNRPGALTVWASLTTELAKELKSERPNRPIIAYGHSRYGKTALLSAAYSASVDAVISHQSGTVGASLMRDKTGESLKDVVRGYSHWVKPSAAEYAENPKSLPSDAHALLAVIAPKPILLGNARRDVWSDPEGAYQAARWASDNSSMNFSATRLDNFIPADNLAIWTRPGTHGVVEEDWQAFLEFLDAHFENK